MTTAGMRTMTRRMMTTRSSRGTRRIRRRTKRTMIMRTMMMTMMMTRTTTTTTTMMTTMTRTIRRSTGSSRTRMITRTMMRSSRRTISHTAPVLRSRHFFGRLRMIKVPELTPVPAPTYLGRLRLQAIIFFHFKLSTSLFWTIFTLLNCS